MKSNKRKQFRIYKSGGVFLNRRSFFKGFTTGILITVFVLLATLGVLVYFDAANLGQLAGVIYRIQMYSFKPLSLEDMVTGAIEGVVQALEDPYSSYLSPEEYSDLDEHISGTYGGIGLLITESEDGRLMVVSPFKGTPAYKAGIKSGDIIVRINGRDISKLSLEEAANLMKGEPGTRVKLTVLPQGNGKLREYSMVRENIHIPSAKGQILTEDPRIAYINLMMFSQQTGEDLKKVFEELDIKRVDGIVLDLRDNPGGSLEAALNVAGYFISKGPAVHIVYRSGKKTLNAPDNYLGKPLVVLVNEGSASASEIVAGAIKDSGSGILVGSKTFGKGLVQGLFEMRNGSALKLTTARYLTPNKHDIHKKGIEPHLEVEMDPELVRQVILFAPDLERDLQLKKAVGVLKDQMEKNS
ncbi:MAG: S41 family peptidase [Clostridia bacterium]|nr:S41 family peptidase [Clostridia bacterium]